MNLNQTSENLPIVVGNPPELNSKNMFRPAVELIRKEYEDLHESLRLAELMDGSGECGKFIWAGYEDELWKIGAWVEARFNIDLDKLESWLYESAMKNDEFINFPYYRSDKGFDFEMVREINNAVS